MERKDTPDRKRIFQILTEPIIDAENEKGIMKTSEGTRDTQVGINSEEAK
jgi:hypothetical protein